MLKVFYPLCGGNPLYLNKGAQKREWARLIN